MHFFLLVMLACLAILPGRYLAGFTERGDKDDFLLLLLELELERTRRSALSAFRSAF